MCEYVYECMYVCHVWRNLPISISEFVTFTYYQNFFLPIFFNFKLFLSFTSFSFTILFSFLYLLALTQKIQEIFGHTMRVRALLSLQSKRRSNPNGFQTHTHTRINLSEINCLVAQRACILSAALHSAHKKFLLSLSWKPLTFLNFLFYINFRIEKN